MALKALGADAEPVERFRTEGGCGIDDPVKDHQTGRCRVKDNTLTGKPVMSCRFALKFADWTANVAAPMARHHLGADLSQLLVGPGYVCRRRNNAKKGKLSEHAFGNAIDITGLKLSNGERVLISGLPRATGPMKRFLGAARITCLRIFHHGPRPRRECGAFKPFPLRSRPSWQDGPVSHLSVRNRCQRETTRPCRPRA